MQQTRNKLNSGVVDTRGGRFVLYGRRDTGKTSLLKSLVIPHFHKHHQSAGREGFVVFCDLMSVSDRQGVSQRLRRSIERGFASSFPTKKRLMDAASAIVKLRPSLTLGDDGKPELSLGASPGSSPDVTELLDGIAKIGRTHPTLLVLDEFQDLHRVAEMEALFRDVFQNFPESVSVVVLGSKKHLLSKIFARPDAPLAGWGEPVNIELISYEEFHEYINERLGRHGLTMPADVCQQMQDELLRVPEDINIICQQILDTLIAERERRKQEEPEVEFQIVTRENIAASINLHLDAAASLYEEMLRPMSSREERLLAAIAKAGCVAEPYSNAFLATAGLPLGTVQKILPALEDEAMIYRERNGITVAKPLLGLYLRKYR